MFDHVPQSHINHHFSLNAHVLNQGRSTSESSWSGSWSDIQSLPPYQSPSLSPSSIQPYPMPRTTPSPSQFHECFAQPRVVGVTGLAGSINNSQPSRQCLLMAAKRRRISKAYVSFLSSCNGLGTGDTALYLSYGQFVHMFSVDGPHC